MRLPSALLPSGELYPSARPTKSRTGHNIMGLGMFRRLTYAALERQLNRAYRTRLASRGATAAGVFWRSSLSQIARFDALLGLAHKIFSHHPVSIADIGCGYGAMLDFILQQPAYRHTDYQGVDINPAMITACRQRHSAMAARFHVGKQPPNMVDFCLFSGTFNLTHGTDADLWLDYIFHNLSACLAKSRQGLILNLICKPKIKIERQIFYANRAAFIARANATLGPTRATTTPHVNDDVTFIITKP
ncbi:MAG: class I SAM-dependent methyltransferase [Alphaproteobacteria bacterium]|nr:class I SAM-dependent methyltransferase [Alphaproteobacteria bacterium]